MKILLIEDQTMFRGVVQRVCQTAFPSAKIQQAATGAAGLAACQKEKPDVVVLDLDLPDIYGLDLIEKLIVTAPRAKIVVLSAHTEDYVIHRCLKLEIDAFVDKNDEPAEAVVEAIESVLRDRPFYSPAVGRMRGLLRSDPAAFTKLLSDREQELLGYFGRGLSDAEVAAKLTLSPSTVQNHRRNIMGRLRLHTAAELQRYAVEKGFAPPHRRAM